MSDTPFPALDPLTEPPFSLGVASFDPLPNRVLLWCVVEGGGTCHWEIATDPAFFDVVGRGKVAAPADTGVVLVDAEGLQPGTAYWYRFTAQGKPSPVGRTRTLPAGADEHLRLGVTCCARFGESPFTVYGELARTDVDLVVHLGDYVYEDTKFEIEERRPEPDHDCVTLEDYRLRHAQARRDPDLQALHARHPMVVVWDDHDLADNAWAGGAKSHDEAEQGPWADRLAAALTAHQEFLPKRLADAADITSAWRTLDAGSFVRILATETRAHRDEQAGLDGAAPADDPQRTMLGAQQAAWLDAAAADPAPRWLVLVSGTVLSPLTIEAPQALDDILPEKYAVVDGRASNSDQWDGYLAERDRVTTALGRRGGRSIVLSGDIHSSWAIEGPCEPDGAPVAVELVCPPAATTPMGQLLPAGVGDRLGPALAHQIEHVRWVDATHHGFVVLTLTEDEALATWWWVDPGTTAATEVGRRWAIPAEGRPRLVDPEPAVAAADPDDEPPSPLSGRTARRWRQLAVAAGTAAAVLGIRRVRRARR